VSAPERFQVGDTVRCVDATDVAYLTNGQTYEIVLASRSFWLYVTNDFGRQCGYLASRFEAVRPTPPALDPFAWTDLAGHMMGNPGIEFDLRIKSAPFITAWVAWSRFCYWAAQSNLAAHFLPTEAAARTRASNGRDVPPATVLVELPVDVVEWWARSTYHFHVDRDQRMAEACRRALGVS